jgi:ATP-dependent Clp protease protease subunit
MALVPMVLEQEGRSERSFDLYSLMMRKRILFCTGEIEDNMCSILAAQLLFLESEDSEKDIYLYVNSPGGSVSAGLSVIDTMAYIKPDVSTICMGMAASMGAMILSAGTKGKRLSLPHSKVMIHQPSSGMGRASASDIQITAREILRTKEVLNQMLVENCEQPLDIIEKAMDRDTWMNAEEALDFGIIDQIVSKRSV